MKRLTATQRIFILLCSLSFLLYVDRVNLSTAAGIACYEALRQLRG